MSYKSDLDTLLTEGVYARTYEELKIDVLGLPEDTNKGSLLLPKQFGCSCPCPFVLNVFADITNQTEDLNNDKNSFLFYANSFLYYNLDIILQKGNCGNWIDFVTITDNSFGRFFAFGTDQQFGGNNFTDDWNNEYTGFQINWLNVLLTIGEGNYRIKAEYTDVFNNVTDVIDPREFCLKQYMPNLVNGTVRIETTITGVRGSESDIYNFIDYGSGWYDQIRLKGIFFKTKSTYIKEFNQYGDAELNAFKPIINEQVPKYILWLKPIPGWLDFYLATNVNQADLILMTDYNNLNRHTYIKHPVICDGDYAQEDEVFQTPNSLATVQIQFSFGKNSLRKRNS